MARKQNEENVLPAVDIKVMVMQLADSARRLKKCGDVEGALDAAATATLYAADANMDARFHRAMGQLKEELGQLGYRPPKFKGTKLKSQLLR